MRTIERNFHKNPHRAGVLLAFHSAGAINIDGEVIREVAPSADLLDEVKEIDNPDLRTDAQIDFMRSLLAELAELDHATAEQATEYTTRMTVYGRWTQSTKTVPGTISIWIDRMKAKVRELRATAAPAPVQPVTDLSPGRYGIEKDGEVKCYAVDYGKAGTKWDGFLFLNRISSDDLFPIKNRAEKALILTAIKADAGAARLLAALTLKKCSDCGRQLSDTKNPYYPIGKGPDCGAK